VEIIRDFIYDDAYSPGGPLVLFSNPANANFITIRYKKDADLTELLPASAQILKIDNPGYPFDYKFVDEDFDKLFKTETLVGKLAAIFASLAVVISCLGLFGLAAYTTERRRKEIGILKVLGASIAGLAGLLSKEFLQLVLLSCVIAFPGAWWAMTQWLQDDAYRTPIYWWVFAAAGSISVFIALSTISFQAIRNALANPVTSLRANP
jgi:putative ABC transport system permease protein